MKTMVQPAVITPTVLVLALLAASVVFIGATGRKVPVLSNVRVDIILVVLLGMIAAVGPPSGALACHLSCPVRASYANKRWLPKPPPRYTRPWP